MCLSFLSQFYLSIDCTYSSAFCSVGLQAYNLKSPNLSLDEVYLLDYDYTLRPTLNVTLQVW
jgi:hypothetical protein